MGILKVMKTTIEMPETLFRKAKAKAALQGVTLKQLVTDAMERELDQEPSESSSPSKQFWDEWNQLAQHMGRAWKSNKSAIKILQEMRR